jgi:uncharacterized protein (DUF885 family)
MLKSLLLAPLLFLSAAAWASPADDFRKLQGDYWSWMLRENPVLATRVGVHDYDRSIRDPSLAAEDRRTADRKAFLARLEAIPSNQLEPDEQVNRAILRRMLRDAIEANSLPQRMMLFTTYYGWHQEFAGLADDLPFRTAEDYRNYLARLAQYPRFNDQALQITKQAIAGGHTIPCSALEGYDKSIAGVVTEDPAQSRFFKPFLGERPADLTPKQWEEMKAEAQRLVRDVLNPAYAKHLEFYRTRYFPACNRADGVSAQAGGPAYYAFRIREETTTDLTADEIHKTGLAEVARIRSEMDSVAKRAGFASREAFIADLRTNPEYYPRSAEDLLARTALTAKAIEAQLPRYFGRLPRLPFGIQPIPAETAEGTTTAYYSPGSPEAGLAGTYFVNTSKLDQRPLWELPALTLHESVPGHHLQIALQQELEIPDWRRHGAFFTVFVEGWALYTERLGIPMGLYDTPAKEMGRLSYEMWRACRLVVDTGIHSKGWTKAQAIAFMTENTALSAHNIEAEVNRYISWPGQALAYKIGEIKIRQLRERAEQALGQRFDLRRFHDAVLAGGPVPLDVLEEQLGRWVESERSRSVP